MSQSKCCKVCSLDLPISEFYRDEKSRDRLRYECKKCCKTAAVARMRANPQSARATWRRYADKHPERLKESGRLYNQTHKAERSAKAKVKYWKDPDKYRAASLACQRKRWAERGPELRAAFRLRYAADPLLRAKIVNYWNRRRKYYAEGTLTAEQWVKIVEDNAGLCVYCGKNGTTMDHIVPFKQGGPHSADNVTTACKSCNSRKRHRTPKQWLLFLCMQEDGIPPLLERYLAVPAGNPVLAQGI